MKPDKLNFETKVTGVSTYTAEEANILHATVDAIIDDYKVEGSAPASHGNEAHSETYLTAADLPEGGAADEISGQKLGELTSLNCVVGNFQDADAESSGFSFVYAPQGAQFKLTYPTKIREIVLRLKKTGTITNSYVGVTLWNNTGGFRSPSALPDINGPIWYGYIHEDLTDDFKDYVLRFSEALSLSAGIYWLLVDSFNLSGEGEYDAQIMVTVAGVAGENFGTWCDFNENTFGGGYQSDYSYLCAAIRGEVLPSASTGVRGKDGAGFVNNMITLWDKNDGDIPEGFVEVSELTGTGFTIIKYNGGETNMTNITHAIYANIDSTVTLTLLDWDGSITGQSISDQAVHLPLAYPSDKPLSVTLAKSDAGDTVYFIQAKDPDTSATLIEMPITIPGESNATATFILPKACNIYIGAP